MKNILILLVSAFLISCGPQKVLKTDTSQEIDLSGRWNETDAEIASNELFNSLMSSIWLKDYQAENDLKPRIEVLEFDSNFKNGGDNLKRFFSQYTQADSSFELIKDRGEKIPEFQLSGKITAEEIITESQNYIDYTLTAKLRNLEGETQWEDKTIVKKYIKD